jgi:uncharacterized protein (TIGR04222 family)
MNPFDLKGPEFLALYAVVAVSAMIVAGLWRRALRLPEDSLEQPPLGPYDVAHLAGGATQAVNAAVARLVNDGAFQIDEAGKLTRGGEAPTDLQPLEARVYGADLDKMKSMREVAAPEVAKIRERLQQHGLLVSDSQSTRARWLPALLLLGVALFGLIKLCVGLARGKPNVGFLVVFIFVTLGVALVGFALRRVHRSRWGDKVLARLKADHAALQTSAASQPGGLTGADLPLAVGLFGVGILAMGPLARLHKMLTPPPGAGGGDASGCGGGDGGGGGGGGCGGGGGGCGGCGGGGGD